MFRHTKILLVCTTIAAFSSGAALWWFTNQVTEKAVLLEDILQSIANEAALNRDQEILLELLRTTEVERATLASYVINGDAGTIEFLSRIDSFARARNISLKTENLSVTPGGRAPFDALTMTYEVVGSERDVQAFIAALETVPYAAAVSQVELMRTANQETRQPQMRARITIALSITNV